VGLLSSDEDENTAGLGVIAEVLPQQKLRFFFYFFYSYVHTIFGSFLPPSPPPFPPTPSLSPTTPSLPGRNYFALISNFVVERV
jgi:hypothetical protein